MVKRWRKARFTSVEKQKRRKARHDRAKRRGGFLNNLDPKTRQQFADYVGQRKWQKPC
jgi:hypothetical protein